jgi:hypothetical protein
MNSMPLVKTSDSLAQLLGMDCKYLAHCRCSAHGQLMRCGARYNQLIPGIVMAIAFLQAKVIAAPLLLKLGTQYDAASCSYDYPAHYALVVPADTVILTAW